MLLYSGVIVAITAAVVAGGVNKGIERVSGVLTPLRLMILVCLLIYSIGFADSGAAFRFLFTVDWTRLTPAVVVTAVGQAFFSLGIGVGVMLTMGAYMKPEYSIRCLFARTRSNRPPRTNHEIRPASEREFCDIMQAERSQRPSHEI
jgi:NSS family neurotransmitter:Na+ symporter